jgi:hypothetical protein
VKKNRHKTAKLRRRLQREDERFVQISPNNIKEGEVMIISQTGNGMIICGWGVPSETTLNS